MKIGEALSYNQVVWEFLRDEWYKNYFDHVRDQYTFLIEHPDFSNEKQNNDRKKILESTRHDVVMPLENLHCEWHLATLENEKDFETLWIIATNDWYRITGTTFQLTKIPQFFDKDTTGNKLDIEKKMEEIKNGTKNNSRSILVGKSFEKLSIVEGNHRLCANYLSGIYQQEVIIGITPHLEKYRWSVEWEYFSEFLSLCEKEEKSFFYKTNEV